MSLLDIAAKPNPSPFLQSSPAPADSVAPPAEVNDLVAAGEILLEIKDFQAHKHLKIGLKGFVAIRGESDLGKSAILRAMRAILANEWPSDYLRDGATESYIAMTFPESTSPNVESIHFWKSSKKNEYGVKLRGKPMLVYPKIGKDVPQEVKDMGFAPVTTEKGDNFYLNFNKQASPWFLVTNSPMEKTSFFNAIFKIQKYEAANRSINSDAMQIHQKINLLTSQAQAKEIDLKNQNDLTSILQKEVDSELELLTKASELEQRSKNAQDSATSIRKEEMSLEEAGAIKDIMSSGSILLGNLIVHLSKMRELKLASNVISTSKERAELLNEQNQNFELARQQVLKETTLLEAIHTHAVKREALLKQSGILHDLQKIVSDLGTQIQSEEHLLSALNKEQDVAEGMQGIIVKKAELTARLNQVKAASAMLQEAQVSYVKAEEGKALCILAARMVNNEIQFKVQLQGLKQKSVNIHNSMHEIELNSTKLSSISAELAVRTEASNCLHKEQNLADSYLATCPTCNSKVNSQHIHTSQ